MSDPNTDPIQERSGTISSQDLSDDISPYLLTVFDNTNPVVVQPVLTGPNYSTWSRSFLLGLSIHNKEALVDGTVNEPNLDDPTYKSWRRTNNVVVSWILKSISEDLANSVFLLKRADEIWRMLQERFAGPDDSRVCRLQHDLGVALQGTRSVDTSKVSREKNNNGVMGYEVVGCQVLGDRKKPIVISGPSGVGKGTLINMLVKEFPSLFGFSVSHTTRAPRDKEKNGVHYHFTEHRVMEEGIKAGKFLEFACVHGNFYGTSLEAVNMVADSGKRCILDIDVQGARLVKATPLDAVFIFIAPPSIDELHTRLRWRGTETEEQMVKRMKNARWEMEQSKQPGLFDHILVNSELEVCYSQLKKLLNVEDVSLWQRRQKTVN